MYSASVQVRKAHFVGLNPTATATTSENAELLLRESSAFGFPVSVSNATRGSVSGRCQLGSGRAPDELADAVRDVPLNVGGHVLVARSHGRV